MGQLVNIVGFTAVPSRRKLTASPAIRPEPSELARLIPGRPHEFHPNAGVPATISARSSTSPGILDQLGAREIWEELTPRFLGRFRAGMLIPASVDLALMTCVAALEKSLFAGFANPALNPASLFVYSIVFLVFALEEDLYAERRWRTITEIGTVLRTLLWTTTFAVLWVSLSPARNTMLAVVGHGGANLCALLAARQVWRMFHAADDPTRNVLIIGSGQNAQQIADAIYRGRTSTRAIKGFIPDNHLRNVYGPSMFSRIAREEFVDEIIIASSDPAVVRTAVAEGLRNALDVRIAPQVEITSRTGEIALENVGCIPLLKIQDHQPPECALTIKRTIDIAAALCGLIVLAPALLLIAALIKFDSKGAVLYRAPRSGCKGRRFVCCKFRTMIPQADAAKNELRALNEREGAFFKLANDPRITRIGRFLRRYSLDELPQLWNVLLGDMSLVGPRPHPPDDVSRYEARHLQRLDFVPGLTGLWQVTARRDPSFERSVALDVEYIKTWNLWLDARILWRTISVVLQGSGA